MRKEATESIDDNQTAFAGKFGLNISLDAQSHNSVFIAIKLYVRTSFWYKISILFSNRFYFLESNTMMTNCIVKRYHTINMYSIYIFDHNSVVTVTHFQILLNRNIVILKLTPRDIHVAALLTTQTSKGYA